MAMGDIILIVSERDKRDGIFDCHHDGRYLCSSPSPFIDGCRHLLAHGYDPTAKVIMRHTGSDIDALRGVLAQVAGVEIAGSRVGFRSARVRPTLTTHGVFQAAQAPPMPPPALVATTLHTSC